MKKSRCDDCPSARKQCQSCCEWDKCCARMAESLSKTMAAAMGAR
jgi:hypothetical protein